MSNLRHQTITITVNGLWDYGLYSESDREFERATVFSVFSVLQTQRTFLVATFCSLPYVTLRCIPFGFVFLSSMVFVVGVNKSFICESVNTFLGLNFKRSMSMSSVLDEVERYTELAHTKLKRRDDDNAIKLFKLALQRAKSSSDDTLIPKAAINLGAALVAVRRSHEALKILCMSAKSPPSDGSIAGDLFYNLALVNEQLGNKHEARKHFQKSFDLYAVEPECGLLQAGIACKLAALRIELSEYKTAAEAFGEAASLYKSFNLPEQQALCLYQKILVLEASGSDFEAVTTASDCEVICQGIALGPNIGMLLLLLISFLR